MRCWRCRAEISLAEVLTARPSCPSTAAAIRLTGRWQRAAGRGGAGRLSLHGFIYNIFCLIIHVAHLIRVVKRRVNRCRVFAGSIHGRFGFVLCKYSSHLGRHARHTPARPGLAALSTAPVTCPLTSLHTSLPFPYITFLFHVFHFLYLIFLPYIYFFTNSGMYISSAVYIYFFV